MLFSMKCSYLCCLFFLLIQVAELTDSIQQIVEALQGSPFVEVQVPLVYICPVVCKFLNYILSLQVEW